MKPKSQRKILTWQRVAEKMWLWISLNVKQEASQQALSPRKPLRSLGETTGFLNIQIMSRVELKVTTRIYLYLSDSLHIN